MCNLPQKGQKLSVNVCGSYRASREAYGGVIRSFSFVPPLCNLLSLVLLGVS